ncbi:YIP1 family protein [Falsirhodobacter halotolerans]|uniref:YIP1 family protein n=1 Tax=Falsirhodobacter halotolerans TaxID=1146892 RepID=UPI001FD43876|nr:YIP1 family protein [Falsirhodobacter halotolerans]MCJ8139468.1 YIP1 family protein [Falsirhodobacter halotolerans]
MPSMLLPLMVLSLRDPRGGIRIVLNLPWGDQARWALFGLATICPAIILVLSFALEPEMVQMAGGQMLSPFAVFGVQAAAVLLFVWLTHVAGRWRGGHGSFAGALVTLSWFQLCLVPVQAALLLIGTVSVGVADIAGTLFVLWAVWMVTNFICELHGFKSLALVLLGMFGTMAVLILGLSVLAALVIGPPNV